MSNITQGQNIPRDPTVHSSPKSRGPRRSVLIGAVGSLIAGIVIGTTALPSMATVVEPTVNFGTGTTIATTTTAPVTTTSVVKHVAKVTSTRPPVTTTTVARKSHVTHIVTKTTKTTAKPTSQASPAPTTTTTLPRSGTTTTTTLPVTKEPTPTISNPSVNIAPNPNFLEPGKCTFGNGVWSCANPCVAGTATALSWPGYTNAAACTNYVLLAINNARAVEGVPPMALPSNWYNITTTQQLFVIADLERTARGLPAYVGINAALSADAQHAAQANSDPTIAAGFPMANDAQGSPGFGGAWSGGYSILAADYIWMYDDAWGGSAATTSNISCTSVHAAGCWAHRDELLGSDPGYNPGVGLNCTNCEMGTGFAMVNGGASYVDLIEIPKGSMPPMTFTWVNNVLPYL